MRRIYNLVGQKSEYLWVSYEMAFFQKNELKVRLSNSYWE